MADIKSFPPQLRLVRKGLGLPPPPQRPPGRVKMAGVDVPLPPNPEVVAACRHLLKWAESGDLQALGYAIMVFDREPDRPRFVPLAHVQATGLMWTAGLEGPLQGAISTLLHRANTHMCEGLENYEAGQDKEDRDHAHTGDPERAKLDRALDELFTAPESSLLKSSLGRLEDEPA